ncbi:hypothetical protein PR048_012466 [Dryococelus australis]|uniref:Uncharacterized protein n=1 Tax=Dryococelus australis TaxID=614101 RepID=A0ABQ9HPK1_9NEOP|nr:hypothetical protein PR048_012466 [Dryococelus australis]
MDFFLWGHVKCVVYSTPVATRQDLVEQIFVACDQLHQTPHIFARVRQSLLRRCTGVQEKLFGRDAAGRQHPPPDVTTDQALWEAVNISSAYEASYPSTPRAAHKHNISVYKEMPKHSSTVLLALQAEQGQEAPVCIRLSSWCSAKKPQQGSGCDPAQRGCTRSPSRRPTSTLKKPGRRIEGLSRCSTPSAVNDDSNSQWYQETLWQRGSQLGPPLTNAWEAPEKPNSYNQVKSTRPHFIGFSILIIPITLRQLASHILATVTVSRSKLPGGEVYVVKLALGHITQTQGTVGSEEEEPMLKVPRGVVVHLSQEETKDKKFSLARPATPPPLNTPVPFWHEVIYCFTLLGTTNVIEYDDSLRKAQPLTSVKVFVTDNRDGQHDKQKFQAGRNGLVYPSVGIDTTCSTASYGFMTWSKSFKIHYNHRSRSCNQVKSSPTNLSYKYCDTTLSTTTSQPKLGTSTAFSTSVPLKVFGGHAYHAVCLIMAELASHMDDSDERYFAVIETVTNISDEATERPGELLIGADMLPRLLTGGNTDGSPVALDSVLGWILTHKVAFEQSPCPSALHCVNVDMSFGGYHAVFLGTGKFNHQAPGSVDVSTKSANGLSLNNILLTGPRLQHDIKVLLKFVVATRNINASAEQIDIFINTATNRYFLADAMDIQCHTRREVRESRTKKIPGCAACCDSWREEGSLVRCGCGLMTEREKESSDMGMAGGWTEKRKRSAMGGMAKGRDDGQPVDDKQ